MATISVNGTTINFDGTATNISIRNGEVRGFNLVYSGNFLAQLELDQFASARTQLGINPFDFALYAVASEARDAAVRVMVATTRARGAAHCGRTTLPAVRAGLPAQAGLALIARRRGTRSAAV